MQYFTSWGNTSPKDVKISYMYDDKTRTGLYYTTTQIIGQILDVYSMPVMTAYQHVTLVVRNSQAQLTRIKLNMIDKITLLPTRPLLSTLPFGSAELGPQPD